MIRKAIIVVLLLSAGLTVRMWVNVSMMQRAASFKVDFLSISFPGLPNVMLTDDQWLPSVDQRFAETSLTLPYSMVITLLLAYPAVAFIRGPVRRYQRRRLGLCLKCGYNLEGTVSGVCPECGETT